MKAWLIRNPGGPEAFALEDMDPPAPQEGRVLIAVRAIGLNRSEWFTRRGDSPSVRFPRVLGIECVGEVVDAPGTDLVAGQRVAAMMGGMGRVFDGSYAELTSVPRANVFPLQTSLPWEDLGALPEMLQTVHGSLSTGLEVDRARSLLIRGGTSSIGLTTLGMAKARGLFVATTTRSEDKTAMLFERGADEVFVDAGELTPQVRAAHPEGLDRVQELIGATTLLDSLQLVKPGGIVCMTGILGGQWELPTFRPMGQIPTGVKLTSYGGEASDISAQQLQDYVALVEEGTLALHRGPTFPFTELREAHALMDANRANGKIVVVVRS